MFFRRSRKMVAQYILRDLRGDTLKLKYYQQANSMKSFTNNLSTRVKEINTVTVDLSTALRDLHIDTCKYTGFSPYSFVDVSKLGFAKAITDGGICTAIIYNTFLYSDWYRKIEP